MAITDQQLAQHLNTVYPQYGFFYDNVVKHICYRNDIEQDKLLFICKLHHITDIAQVFAISGVAKLIDACFDPVRMN